MRQKAQLLLDEAATWSLLWFLYGKGNISLTLDVQYFKNLLCLCPQLCYDIWFFKCISFFILILTLLIDELYTRDGLASYVDVILLS